MAELPPPRARNVAAAVTLLVVVAAVAASGAPTAGNGVYFDQREYTVASGDVLEVGVYTQDVRTVTLLDADGEVRYEFTVSNGSESDLAWFRIHTHRSGAASVTGVGADEVAVERAPDRPLSTGNYTLRSPRSWPADVTVTEPQVNGVRVYRAPADATESVDSLAAFEAAKANRTVVRQVGPTAAHEVERLPMVALGETLVVEIRAAGLAGPVTDRSGTVDAAAFESYLNGTDGSPDRLLIAQDEASVPVQRPLSELYPLGSSNSRLLANASNGTYVLLIDLGADGTHNYPDHPPTENALFDATLQLGCADAQNCTATGRDTFQVVGPAATVSSVEPDGDALVIDGRTTLPPWESVTVRLHPDEAVRVGVNASGSFSVRLPYDGSDAEVVVEHDETELARRAVLAGTTPTATESSMPTPTETSTTSATPTRATTPVESATPTRTDGETPGFGPVIAVAALLLAALARVP